MALGRMYTASFSSAETAAQDLIELNAPADAVVVVHSISIEQSTEEGDAQAEMLSVQLARCSTTTAGSGGASATARPHNVGAPAYGGTVEYSNTTQATTQTVIQERAFNVQAGFYYMPTPDERIVISPSGIFIVGLTEAPADSVTFHVTITFEEIGG